MSDSTFRVKIDVKNVDARTALQEIIRSVEGLWVQGPDDNHRPDLLILELGDKPEDVFELIESLLSVNAVGEVFLTSSTADSSVLLKAMRTGVKEFFSQPVNKKEVRQALEKFKLRREQAADQERTKVGHIVDVIGSKGGVGTTTVAVNLAVDLAHKDSTRSVALLDMNLLFGEIPLFLEIKPTFHWGEVTKNIARLDPTFLMNILSKHSSGVYVLPSPGILNGAPAAAPEVMERLLSLMQTMFDVIVIDGGQSLEATSLKILEISDTVLLISTLGLPCLSNTNKLLKTFRALGYPSPARIKVVINRYLKDSDVSLKEAEQGIQQKIFWSIPNDYRTTIAAINHGKALSEIASKAQVTRSLEALADAVIQGEDDQAKKGWRFLKRR